MTTPQTNRPSRPPKRNFAGLKSRLKQAGISGPIVKTYLLPEWWDKDCEQDCLGDFEFEVARFLSAPIDDVRNPEKQLQLPASNARLRAPKNADLNQLLPAVHVASRVASAVVRTLNRTVGSYVPLPNDPKELRDSLGGIPTLPRLLEVLWGRHGVPVISIKELPSPKFKALACWAEDRPVIVIGRQDNDWARTLVNLGHEVGHVGSGHITEDSYIVEGDDEEADETTDFEKEAWSYYRDLMFGSWNPESLVSFPNTYDAFAVAKEATELARSHQVDQSLLVHLWATRKAKEAPYDSKKAWGTRKYVLRMYETAFKSQRQIRLLTERHLNLHELSETDETLLRACTL